MEAIKKTGLLLLKAEQAAELLAISRRTLHNWTAANKVPHVRLNGMLRYPIDELRAWIREHRSNKTLSADDAESINESLTQCVNEIL